MCGDELDPPAETYGAEPAPQTGKEWHKYMYMPAFTSVQVVLDDRGWKGLVRAPLPVGQQLLLFAPRAGSRVMTRPRAP